ncbi:protein transport protein sec13 [Strigomonas culicis]|uniref:Protein transport protein sec13 n=1 Tax=Strigomonas culicis TaxID=28005 RepID=S9UZX8_9TRYP|nr:protein transport protein sec13 [Strigomonas culicis]|eukprot:EPY34328.1 protein transport protein sec13 [Strigomonas culicis]
MVAPLEPGEGPPMAVAPPRFASCAGGRHLQVWEHAFVARDGGSAPCSVWAAVEPVVTPAAAWTVVAWAPSVGLPFTYVAAGSEEGHVVVLSQDGPASAEWRTTPVHQMPGAVSALSWSQTGTLLLASSADGTAVMFREAAGGWEPLSDISKPTF